MSSPVPSAACSGRCRTSSATSTTTTSTTPSPRWVEPHSRRNSGSSAKSPATSASVSTSKGSPSTRPPPSAKATEKASFACATTGREARSQTRGSTSSRTDASPTRSRRAPHPSSSQGQSSSLASPRSSPRRGAISRHPRAGLQNRSAQERPHGVLAPGSKRRALVVPKPSDDDVEAPPHCRRKKHEQPRVASPTGTFLDVLPRRTRVPVYRVPWAELLRRTFGVDALACPRCEGRMRVIAYSEEPSVARKILRHLGLPDSPLPTTRSRGPPEEAFAW